MPETAIVDKKVTPKPRMKMVEITVDENLTVIRKLVPEDTPDDDLPANAIIYSAEETEMRLKRQNKPPLLKVGFQVTLHPGAEGYNILAPVMGTIDGETRTGLWRVKWDNGSISRHKASELVRVF